MKKICLGSNRCSGRLRLACAAVATAGLLCCGPLLGNTYTWTGQSGPPFFVPNWQHPLNWESFAVPTSSGETTDIVFGATAFPISQQDVANPLFIHSMTFTTAAPAYVLFGDPIRLLAGSIVQNSAAPVTIQNNLAFDFPGSYSGSGSTRLTGILNGELAVRTTGTLTLAGGGAMDSLSVESGTVAVTAGVLDVNGPNLSLGVYSSLSITGGAVVNVASNAWIVSSNPATGVISVSGSTLTAGVMALGNNFGPPQNGGTLEVADQGSFTAGIFLLQGGVNRASTLKVSTGSTARTQLSSVGSPNNSVGSAIITGPGSMWEITEQLELGGDFFSSHGTGSITVENQGKLLSAMTSFNSASSAITVNGGSFSTGRLDSDGVMGSISLTDPAVGPALTISGHDGIYSGAISGGGSVLKSGVGTQTLAGSNTYIGTTTVNGGTLILASGASSTYIADSGGTLRMDFGNFGSSDLVAYPGGTIKYNAALLNGGVLWGLGTHDLSAVNVLNYTGIADSGTVINQATPMTMIGMANMGVINSTAPLILNGFLSVGQLAINSTANSQGLFESGGVLTIGNLNPAASLTHTGSNLLLIAGSSTFIGTPTSPGGSLTIAGANTLGLNGALLVNNGTITGTTNINSGSLAKGSGRYGPVNVNNGGKFSPGNSPGAVTTGTSTWGQAGGYLFEINNAAGTEGVNWDLWNIDGSLSIMAEIGASRHFVLSIASLTAANLPGNAGKFNNTQNYSWLIATATRGITGFDAGKFTIDSSQFTNSLGGGTFSIAQADNNLFLNFARASQSSEWIFDGPDGSWSNPANWSTGVVPNSPTASANFLNAISFVRRLTLDGDKTVHEIHFNSPYEYMIDSQGGGILTVGDGATGLIEVAQGAHEIYPSVLINGNASITGPGYIAVRRALTIAPGKTLTKSGSGEWYLGGAGDAVHGTIAVTGGQFDLNYYTETSDMALSISSGPVLVYFMTNHGGPIPESNHPLKSLSIAVADPGSQTLDLYSDPNAGSFTSISVFAADLDASKAALWGAIVNANRAGAVDPLDGIIDSGQHPNSRLGIAKLGNHVLIRSTQIGDLNLDGQVTISDFIDLASHFGVTGTWQEGDLNYDGLITISDFIDLASNFGQSYAGEALPITPQDQAALDNFAASIGAGSVPEPSTLLALLLPMGIWLGRRHL